MKRFVSIVMIALVVLAMSAGTAFASVCIAPSCAGTMRCDLGATSLHMGMEMPPSTGIQARCNMGAQRTSSDIVAPQSHAERPEPAVAAPAPVLAPIVGSPAAVAFVPAGARGAPHLSAVLRL